ncbi:hypothetical protein [Terricaulis sp.]|uniref:M61 family metallopeptidase n=1 Tax=Terricaulis sp. TaxID=2768686 RepID=UPI0037844151
MTFIRTTVVCAWVAFAALVTAGATNAPRVTYTLTPLLENGALHAVQVDIDFRGAGNGQTVLDLPDSWGGEEELYRTVQELAVTGASLRDGASAAQRVLVHRPNARVHVRYRIVQDWDGEPRAQGRNPYRAMVQPGYFQFIGYAALAIPELDEQSPANLRTRLPRGWSFASDLQHADLTLGEVQRSVTVGGDYRIVRTTDPNIRVAIRGAWLFADDAIATETLQILNAQRGFWGDASTPFLVTVTQLAAPPESISIGGTGLGDAFAFYATPNAESARITRVLAHEGLHTWIPDAIGGMSSEGTEERLAYWLSEGFTDFYTARLLVRDHVWTPQQYAADLNDMLSAYAHSPVRTAPNTRIGEDFWNDNDVRQLPYQRGRLLALMWDARLRAAAPGRDMDDLMMAMRTRHRADSAANADALFPLAAADVGLALGDELDRHVTRGEMVLLPETAFGPCGRVVTREVPNFHRGFDISATQANDMIIAGVIRTGPAYAAGMRDGMVLIRRTAGEIGDATQPITYVVRDGEAERSITYIPRTAGTFTEQRLELASPLEGEALAQCVRVLGG